MSRAKGLQGYDRELIERWLDIIHARVCDGQTWAQIGEEFGISTSRARDVGLKVPREVWEAIPELRPVLHWWEVVPGEDLGHGVTDPGNKPWEIPVRYTKILPRS